MIRHGETIEILLMVQKVIFSWKSGFWFGNLLKMAVVAIISDIKMFSQVNLLPQKVKKRYKIVIKR